MNAQLTFETDAQGHATALTLHRMGVDHNAPRMDDQLAQQIEDELKARVQSQTPNPGTEAALRRYYAGLMAGKLVYDETTPFLAEMTRQNLYRIETIAPQSGAIQVPAPLREVIHLLHLGLFPGFRDLNAVLLAADSEGITTLFEALTRTMANATKPVAIHEIASVAHKYPVRLFLTGDRAIPSVVPPNTYHWVVTEESTRTVMGLLEVFRGTTAGHQYFDLVPSAASLIVSVGEYDDSWWERSNA
jgi:hypothetical protein